MSQIPLNAAEPKDSSKANGKIQLYYNNIYTIYVLYKN